MDKEFLHRLVEAYMTYDASIIEKYLADDMLCINVGPKMTSKKEYLDYLTRTLHAMKMHNVQMEFEIVQGRMHRYALLITNQQTSSGEYGGFVVDFNNEGKVKTLSIAITSSCFF